MPFEIADDPIIKDVKIVNSEKFNDNRGFFEEVYREKILKDLNIQNKFSQVNLSFSKKKCFPWIPFPVKS